MKKINKQKLKKVAGGVDPVEAGVQTGFSAGGAAIGSALGPVGAIIGGAIGAAAGAAVNGNKKEIIEAVHHAADDAQGNPVPIATSTSMAYKKK